MKNRIVLTLVIVSLFVCLFAITSSATEVNGIDYSFSSSDGVNTATVNSNNVNCKLEIANIPETVEYKGVTYTVTTVAGNAFSGSEPNKWAGNKTTKEVYIPATVTSIGDHCFRNCTALTKVKISGSDENFYDAVFYNCTSLVEVDLSEMKRLDSMGQYCFSGCSKLTTIKLPNCLKEINGGSEFLRGCSSLTSIVLPDSITKISDYSFQNAQNLTSINIPKNLVTLGCNNFQSSKVTEMILPSTLEVVGKHIFHGSKIKTLVIASTNIDLTRGTTPTNMFDGSNVTLIFYAGATEAEAKAFATPFAKIKNWTNFISYDTYLKEIKENPTKTYTNTIVYGTRNCSNCSNITNDDVTFQFTNYLSPMQDANVCSCGKTNVVKSYDAIMEFAGYSAKINGDKICVGYTVNGESLKVFTEKTGKTLTLGVAAAIVADNTTEYKAVNSDLSAINDKTVVAPVNSAFAGFDFVISGFTEDYYLTNLVMCAFVYDGEKIYYVDNGGCNEDATPFTFVSVAK